MKRTPRRILAGALIVIGVAVMALAPDSPGGWIALAAAVGIELLGITLERRRG